MKPCPECGSYRVLPHCNNPSCRGEWCLRAQCGWTKDGCDKHDRDLFNPWQHEKVEGFAKMQYQPAIRIGNIYRHRTFSNRYVFSGTWLWDATSGLPEFPVEDVAEMFGTMDDIRKLPGPTSWW